MVGGGLGGLGVSWRARPADSAYLGYARTLPMLERAVAGYPEVDVHPYQVALSRAALARALWGAGGDRDRARSLAREAIEALARGGRLGLGA
ncbi:hypothetical protein [Nannocystis sp. SCPEA4]|uniref:hypothetical protein n=1 Tax=Nannocystis sp. SCPEA4 TaxID=2996787 RepID=UPI002271DC61|nr:hypothetical protein [Nannocystis sp. SCPEA4]MCY1056814.1 hypothetical protein [Nannocystis sp. SCPEA4]